MEFSTTCEAATVLLLQLFITVFFSFRLLVVYVCWFHIFLSVEWLITFSIHWLPVVYFEYTYFAICSDTILYKLFLTCRSDLIFWFHFSFFFSAYYHSHSVIINFEFEIKYMQCERNGCCCCCCYHLLRLNLQVNHIFPFSVHFWSGKSGIGEFVGGGGGGGGGSIKTVLILLFVRLVSFARTLDKFLCILFLFNLIKTICSQRLLR